MATLLPQLPTLDDLVGRPARQVAVPAQTLRAIDQVIEDDSLIDDVLGGGMSALSFVGNVLDTPGSWIRNLLAGENPFQGTFDTDQRTSGRELLQEFGVLGSNRPGFDMGDVAGFGAEVVFDPLTYLTLGTSAALSASGKAAKAAGMLPKAVTSGGKLVQGKRAQMVSTTLDDLLKPVRKAADEGSDVAKKSLDDLNRAAMAQGTTVDALAASGETLSSLAQFKLPGLPGIRFGKSERVASALDDLGFGIRYSRPGREVARMFDYASRGFRSGELQRAAAESTSTMASANANVAANQALAHQALERAGLRDSESWTDIRSTIEGTFKLTKDEEDALRAAVDAGEDYGAAVERLGLKDFDAAFDRNILGKMQGSATSDEISSLREQLRNISSDYRDEFNRMKHLGMDPMEQSDRTIDHLRRTHRKTEADLHLSAGTPFTTTTPSQIQRKDFLTELLPTAGHSGGSAAVEQVLRDDDIVGGIADAGDKFQSFRAARAQRKYGNKGATVYRKLTKDLDALERQSAIDELVKLGETRVDAEAIVNGSQAFRDRTKTVFEKYHYGSQKQADRLDELADLETMRPGVNPFDEGTHEAALWQQGAEGLTEPNSLPPRLSEAHALGAKNREAVEEKYRTLLSTEETAELEGLRARWSMSESLADFAARREMPDPDQLYWNVNPIDDHAMIRRANEQAMAGVRAVYRAVGDGAQRIDEAGEGAERLLSFLEKQGTGIKDTDTAVARAAEQLSHRADELGLDEAAIERLSGGMNGYMDEAMELAEDPEDLAAIESMARDLWETDRAAVFDDLAISRQLGDELTNAQQHWMPTAKSDNFLLKFFDKLHNTTRTHLTAPFLSFHTRNGMTGAWMQLVSGAYDPTVVGGKANPLAYVKPIKDGIRFTVQGKMPKGWEQHPWFRGRNLTEQEATEELRAQFFAQRVSEPHMNIGQEVVGGDVAEPLHDILDALPGPKKKPGPSFKWHQQLNPFAVKGGFGRGAELAEETGVDPFFATRWGRHYLGNPTEDVNRFATWWAKGKQGYSFETAADVSRTAHVDYRKLTDWERNVAKRFVSFYTFSRHMLPVQVSHMMHRPGGVVAQAVRAGNLSRDEDYVPDYVGRGLAIGLGDNEDGTRRYLTGFDLPHEIINDLFVVPNVDTSSPGGAMQSVANSAGEQLKTLLGQMNPVIKGSIEQATGQQFYSGRDLADLDSNVGRLIQKATGAEHPPYVPQAVDQLLGNLPTARYASTARMATDDRKSPWLRVLQGTTGMRVTDADIGRSRRAAARDALEELLRPLPQVRPFERLYVTDEQYEQLNPRQQQLADLYAELMK